jgi:hypothetical protein
LVEIGIGD